MGVKLANAKKVWLYDINGSLIKIFKTSFDCADYFDYDIQYIYHNIKYCKKIWNKKERKWYVIKREEI